jgi:DNA gyrase subunit B
VTEWVEKLQAKLDDTVSDGKIYTGFVRRDSERNLYFPVVKLLSHGVESETEYHHEFFGSGEYRSLCELGDKITGLIEEGGYVERGDKRHETRSFFEVFDWLMAEAARGYNIQRYKGLGEMNPDQLWETTMDPETRRLLRVTIDDAIAADQIFTTLMGDQVEPRRDFIEDNALSVANLDV